ncbi:hypothetical protein ALMP_79280 [Streptomyces sp. A012304]|nr:hypothetical protein ALMP_79280 [Streptomyces sp. A012304]
MSVTLREYSREELAAQPIGSWTGEAYRQVVGALRAQLAVEDLTQPHWWTLNHVAGEPGKWTRAMLSRCGWCDHGVGVVLDSAVHRVVHASVRQADHSTASGGRGPGPQGRPWSLPLEDRVLLVAAN